MIYPKKVKPLPKSNRQKSGQKEVFMEVWNTRPHVCVICGKHIPEPKAHNFSHIKPKGLYPELKFDISNIEILCFDCHYQYTNGGKYSGISFD